MEATPAAPHYQNLAMQSHYKYLVTFTDAEYFLKMWTLYHAKTTMQHKELVNTFSDYYYFLYFSGITLEP